VIPGPKLRRCRQGDLRCQQRHALPSFGREKTLCDRDQGFRRVIADRPRRVGPPRAASRRGPRPPVAATWTQPLACCTCAVSSPHRRADRAEDGGRLSPHVCVAHSSVTRSTMESRVESNPGRKLANRVPPGHSENGSAMPNPHWRPPAANPSSRLQAGGHWFDPSTAHQERAGNRDSSSA
jgi:hypothetical protein